MKLPLAALDLAGYGGTNFSKLELLRSDSIRFNSFAKVLNIGHTCSEMLEFVNAFYNTHEDDIKVQHIIFSGGIKDFLDGFYLMEKCSLPSFYAQASGFLKYALEYDKLIKHTCQQIEGLKMAKAFLKVKN